MSAQRSRRPGEFAFALLIGVFSALALWQAYAISGFDGLATAGVFPMLAAAAMLVAALFVIRDTAAKPRADRRTPETVGGQRQSVLPRRLIVVIGLVVLYVLVMPYIGFMFASAGFLFAVFSYLWRKGLLVSVILTAVTLASIYVVFRILFQVVLPKGTLVQGLL